MPFGRNAHQQIGNDDRRANQDSEKNVGGKEVEIFSNDGPGVTPRSVLHDYHRDRNRQKPLDPK